MSHDNDVTFTGFLVGIFNRVPFPNGAPLELTKASSIPSLKVIHCRNKAFRKLSSSSDDSF